MSKNIVRTYAYSEGPFVISLIEDEEGNILEDLKENTILKNL